MLKKIKNKKYLFFIFFNFADFILIHISLLVKKEKEELKKDLDKELRNKTRYGLVWEEKEEQFEKDMKKHLPILEEVNDKKIINNSEGNDNLLIEGDNYHSLTNLQYTHKGEIDVIYIVPPYNTLNKSAFDKKVSSKHTFMTLFTF